MKLDGIVTDDALGAIDFVPVSHRAGTALDFAHAVLRYYAKGEEDRPIFCACSPVPICAIVLLSSTGLGCGSQVDPGLRLKPESFSRKSSSGVFCDTARALFRRSSSPTLHIRQHLVR